MWRGRRRAGIVVSVKTVVFTGASGAGVRAVVERVTGVHDDVRAVVLSPSPTDVPGAEVHAVDLVGVALGDFMGDADAVVHLGSAVDGQDPYGVAVGRIVAEATSVLDAALASGVSDVIVVSSALVLGAGPSNPVPLTEQAVVHPEPGCAPAVELAEIERIVAERILSGQVADDVVITVLRAAPVVTDGDAGWLAGELHRSLTLPVEGADPGLQYLHVLDLADAIAVVVQARPGGVVHVAPDGALTGAERRALETRPRLHVEDSVARLAARVRSSAAGTGAPEGIQPYVRGAWVLSNDRLRSLGWAPRHTNEQAYAAAFPAPSWTMLPSGRRQDLILTGVAGVGLTASLGTAILWRRRHRR